MEWAAERRCRSRGFPKLSPSPAQYFTLRLKTSDEDVGALVLLACVVLLGGWGHARPAGLGPKHPCAVDPPAGTPLEASPLP
jgi:hypothetical protein